MHIQLYGRSWNEWLTTELGPNRTLLTMMNYEMAWPMIPCSASPLGPFISRSPCQPTWMSSTSHSSQPLGGVTLSASSHCGHSRALPGLFSCPVPLTHLHYSFSPSGCQLRSRPSVKPSLPLRSWRASCRLCVQSIPPHSTLRAQSLSAGLCLAAKSLARGLVRLWQRLNQLICLKKKTE